MGEVAKYVYVDDAEHVARIKKGIERKIEKYGAGYCPCVGPAAHNEDTICPCKEYRETGYCHCKMYKERKMFRSNILLLFCSNNIFIL